MCCIGQAENLGPGQAWGPGLLLLHPGAAEDCPAPILSPVTPLAQAAAYALGSLARGTPSSWRGKLSSPSIVEGLVGCLQPGPEGRRLAALHTLRCPGSPAASCYAQ